MQSSDSTSRDAVPTTASSEVPELVDTRGMPAPENVLAVLRKIGELRKGTVLEIRSDSNPLQLYDLLQQRGCLLEMQKQSDGSYRGFSRPREMKSSTS